MDVLQFALAPVTEQLHDTDELQEPQELQRRIHEEELKGDGRQEIAREPVGEVMACSLSRGGTFSP